MNRQNPEIQKTLNINFMIFVGNAILEHDLEIVKIISGVNFGIFKIFRKIPVSRLVAIFVIFDPKWQIQA